MIFGLFRKSTATDAVFAVYRAIVAQSRQSRLYAEWGVPDTITGRFDMVSVHLALLLRRLKGDAAGGAVAQGVVDLFFQDMDRSLREMGTGDLAVPKKIGKMGNLFYGLAAALGTALDSADAAEVEAVLVRNVYGAANQGAAPLAVYLVDAAKALEARPIADIVAGTPEIEGAA